MADEKPREPQASGVKGLEGKLITDTKYEHSIVHFGRKGEYYDYYVVGPVIPDMKSSRCGNFSFSQVKLVVSIPSEPGSRYTNSYLVTLKNGKSYNTNTNIPFSSKDANSSYTYNTLVDSVDAEKRNWFWFLAKDKSFSEPQEFSVKPSKIRQIEFN